MSVAENAAAPGLPPVERIRTEAFGRNPAGLEIDIRRSGPADAPVVFCLHGIGSNATGYAAQLLGLSDRYNVIAWNAPGYGTSTPLPFAQPEAEDYAHALYGLADALGIEAAVVVGSSFGGVIAAYFGALYPAQAKALVLSAPAAGNAQLPEAQRRAMLRGRIDDMRALGPKGVADKRSTVLVAPGTDDATLAKAHALVAASHPDGYIQAAHVLDSADTVAIAARIAAPTLVLVGSEDKVTPADTCARPIHAALPKGELHELQGIGHLIKLEAPDRFNDLAGTFLSKHGIA